MACGPRHEHPRTPGYSALRPPRRYLRTRRTGWVHPKTGGMSSARLTRRARVLVGATVLVLLAGTGVVVARTLLGGPDCVVTLGDRSVGLSRDQAEAVTTAVAPRVRP